MRFDVSQEISMKKLNLKLVELGLLFGHHISTFLQLHFNSVFLCKLFLKPLSLEDWLFVAREYLQ